VRNQAPAKSEPIEPVSVGLTASLLARLDAKAEADDRSRSQVIRYAIESYLAEQPEGRKAG
jgi:metal-responsive CopG/Arc/MetJ family transcriptional regulator